MTEFSQEALMLVASRREEEGSRSAVTLGALMLAELMVADEGKPASLDDPLAKFANEIGGWRNIDRMIAGALLPCQDWGEMLGRMTDGRLTSASFLRHWNGDLPILAAAEPETVTVVVAEVGGPDGDTLTPLHGRLGEVPSGQLFRHIVDPQHPGDFVVTGLGMAWRFTEATAFAMRTTLSAALLDIGAMNGRGVY